MAKQFIHSASWDGPYGSTVVVSEVDIDTGKPSLNIIKNPKRDFYITKPGMQNHELKKEFEYLKNLDRHMCVQHELSASLFKALNGFESRGYVNMSRLLESPYVYGADIDIDVLIKREYYKRNGNVIPKFNVGMLDIETSMTDKQIIAITYVDTASRQVYTGVLGSYLKIDETQTVLQDKCEELLPQALSTIRKKVKEKLGSLDFKINLFVSNKEIEIIEWVFKNLHKHKPTFCGIWNLDFDIPYILDRLEFRGVCPEDIFCHPDVPIECRYVKYKRSNKKKVQHVTDHWHMLYTSGYTQFIDSMALYAALRIVKGKEISYRLDYISRKNLGIGKMEIVKGATHEYLQQNHFVEYVAYNIVDTVLLVLLEELNQDIPNMLGLLSISPIDCLRKQTAQLRNTCYDYCLRHGAVSGSVMGDQSTEYDSIIGKAGGAVLSPKNVSGIGSNVLEEAPNFETQLCRFVCDLDVSKLLYWAQ